MIHAKKVNTVRRKKITNTIAGKVVIIDKTTVATKIRFLIFLLFFFYNLTIKSLSILPI